MQSNILVSVIIPVYNVRPYISEALESVVSQTYKRLEIIVIDDGSTDGSSEIVDEFGDKDDRILIVHQRHEGLSAARNSGLNIMTGEVVAFLDSDDTYDIEYIRIMLSNMIREKADIVMCKYRVYFTENERMNKRKNILEPTILHGAYNRIQALRALADGSINLSVWNKLYKRDLWDSLRYPSGCVYEDGEITCQIFERCGKLYTIDETLYNHRKHRGSITNSFSQKNTIDKISGAARLVSYMESNTPELFSPDQLNRRRESYVNLMIVSYIQVCRLLKDDERIAEAIRKQIIETGKDSIKRFRLRTRAAFRMIYFCPQLLRALFPAYSFVKYIKR